MTKIYSGTYTGEISLINPATQIPTTITATGYLESGVYGVVGVAWTVNNQGRIGSSTDQLNGIQLESGGTVINSGTIWAPGGSYNGVELDGAGGSVTNAVTGLIFGGNIGVAAYDSAGTVVNAGTIEGSTTDSVGIDLHVGGAVDNGQPASTTAFVYGSDVGVQIKGGTGTLSNYGMINGGGAGIFLTGKNSSAANHGLVSGTRYGLFSAYTVLYATQPDAGSVTNSGTIKGNVGVDLVGGGRLTNGSVVSAGGLISGSKYGVALGLSPFLAGSSNSSTITNFGTITGGVGVFISSLDPFGTGANTIVNYGTISGASGTAVAFGGGADTLVVEPNSVLSGAISGFVIGDTIDFADAVGNTVTLNSGVLSLMNGTRVVGTVVLSGTYAAGEFAVASVGNGGTDVTLSQAQLTSTSDFTGDGMSDVLWQNDNAQDSGTGQTAIWLMDGVIPIAEDIITTVPTSWHVIATGDFYGTGDADILWQNDDGQAGLWEMSGTTPTAETVFASPPPDWHLIATGDFNGDGYSDVLWQYEDTANSSDSQNGNVAIWEMNGVSPIPTAVVAQPGPDWDVVATGDFNGDGKSDILWQYEDSQNAGDPQNGNVAIWEMNGLTPTATAVVAQPGPDWHVVGTGDFNGDGMSDILWQYEDSQNASDPQNGTTAIWLMNGTTPTAEAVIAQPGSAWHAVGTGDYDGSGKSDILWQNTNGQAAIWVMNGLTPTIESVFASPPSSWHVIPA